MKSTESSIHNSAQAQTKIKKEGGAPLDQENLETPNTDPTGGQAADAEKSVAQNAAQNEETSKPQSETPKAEEQPEKTTSEEKPSEEKPSEPKKKGKKEKKEKDQGNGEAPEASEPTDTKPLPGMSTIVQDRALSAIYEEGHKVFKMKTVIRLLSILLLSVVFLLLIIYGATIIANREPIFPVKVSGLEGKVTLFATSDMSDPTSHLDIPVIEEFFPLSGPVSIPSDIDNDVIGAKNGDGYIAYTFLARNNDAEAGLPFRERIRIVSSTKGVDKAIRIRIYRNGIPTTYAAMSATGVPEYGTVPFLSNILVEEGSSVLEAGQLTKYTIVVWLEGDDPECINEIGGGTIRLSFSFEAETK